MTVCRNTSVMIYSAAEICRLQELLADLSRGSSTSACITCDFFLWMWMSPASERVHTAHVTT